MAQDQKTKSTSPTAPHGAGGTVKDALGHARAAAQELHGAISDALAKKGGAAKADLDTIPDKARAVMESVKGSMRAQNDATKKQLAAAVTHLEAVEKHAAEGARNSGRAFQTSARQALADARASVQKVSEAIAAKRSPKSAGDRK